MSTGKATASSALTFSVGTKSWMSPAGAGVAAGLGEGVGEGDGLGAGGVAPGACGVEASPAAPDAMAAASVSSSVRISPLIISSRSLRVARDPEAHVRPRLLAVVAVAQPQLRDRPVQEARAADHMVLALRGA